MQQMADWLQKLGLGQYARRFAENDITFSILTDLTDQDLKEIGVSLGHRRQLLREIANLGKTTGAAPAAPALPAQPIAAPTVTLPGEAAGERRHVTVMFCDLVGSTSISAQLDAEEWRDLVCAYLDAASAAVTEMGGHVATPPLPQPMPPSGSCPHGYSASGSFCVPRAGAQDAIALPPNGTCPHGWTRSGSFCLRSGSGR